MPRPNTLISGCLRQICPMDTCFLCIHKLTKSPVTLCCISQAEFLGTEIQSVCLTGIILVVQMRHMNDDSWTMVNDNVTYHIGI